MQGALVQSFFFSETMQGRWVFVSRAHRLLVNGEAVMLQHAQYCIAPQRVEVADTVVVDLSAAYM